MEGWMWFRGVVFVWDLRGVGHGGRDGWVVI